MDCRLVVLAHKSIQFRKVYVTDKKRPSRLLLCPDGRPLRCLRSRYRLRCLEETLLLSAANTLPVILHVVLHSFRQSYNDCIITYTPHLRKPKKAKNTKSQKLPIMADFDSVFLRAHSPTHLRGMCPRILRTFLRRRPNHIFRIIAVNSVTKSFF